MRPVPVRPTMPRFPEAAAPRSAASRFAREPRKEAPLRRAYALRAFVDDQRRLVSALDPPVSDLPEAISLIDGRMVYVVPDLVQRVDPLLQRNIFRTKYGPRLGDERRLRFRLVLRFLAARIDEVRDSGLARGAPYPAVREEFLDHLLRHDLRPGEREIPRYALRGFLDEWSHRWL